MNIQSLYFKIQNKENKFLIILSIISELYLKFNIIYDRNYLYFIN